MWRPGYEPIPPGSWQPRLEVYLSFGATGGQGSVYTDHSAECTVAEPSTGGATSVAISPETVVIDDPDLFEATVTNTFVAPIVEPIVVEPTFTA